MISRRGFLASLGAAAAGLAAPTLWVPERSKIYFLPPSRGWPSKSCMTIYAGDGTILCTLDLEDSGEGYVLQTGIADSFKIQRGPMEVRYAMDAINMNTRSMAAGSAFYFHGNFKET